MSKTARHKAILDLLDEGPVESQDSLQQRLERKGIDVGQATLSRDIHELKLVKGPDGYRRAGENLGADGVLPSVMHLARQFVIEIRQAQNLLVVKTTVGARNRWLPRSTLRTGLRWSVPSPATIPCWLSRPTSKKRKRSPAVFASCRKRQLLKGHSINAELAASLK